MLRSHASVCFLALGGCVRVKVLYDSVFQAPEIPVRCRQIQYVLHLSTPHLRTWYGFFFSLCPWRRKSSLTEDGRGYVLLLQFDSFKI